MREDALFLQESGHLKGSLVLLLCLVDAQAASRIPGVTENRRRYSKYLSDRLVVLNHDASYRIEKNGTVVHLSEIIYEYFRCFLVHEGDARDNPSYEVQLMYEKNPRSKFSAGILVDRPRRQFVVQADWLIELLLAVTESDDTA